MKKYILFLFVFLMVLMPVVGVSAKGLTDPGTVDGEKQSPLYRLFYKEQRITSGSSIAYQDSDGTDYSYNQLFEDMNIVGEWSGDGTVTDEGDYNLFSIDSDNTDEQVYIEHDGTQEENVDYYVSVDAYVEDENIKEFDSIRIGDSIEINSVEKWENISNIGELETDKPSWALRMRELEDKSVASSVRFKYAIQIDLSQFETAPSQSDLDKYRDVYTTVEEGETYYYYTFDGGFISILWVAVLFSGSYLYIRKAEVEDTKQAMVQASIFFIIGLVLLRVIQTII